MTLETALPDNGPRSTTPLGVQKMNVKHVMIGLIAAGGWLCALGVSVGAEPAKVYELRTYHPAAGKMEALHARFRDHTDALFTKHGMKALGYWTPVDKEKDGEVLVYLLEHESQDAAKESWKAFGQDPEWQQAKTESEKDGKLVEKAESVYLQGTDYSKLK